MEFTLRKFKAEDTILMATMLSKIGLGKITDAFGKENVLAVISKNKNTSDNATFTGMAITLQVAEIILGNLESCKGELYTLLSRVSGMSEDEIKDLDAEDFMELIVEVIKMKQFKDFLKVASRLLNSKK